MKTAFALAVHYPEDERVWFQERKSLQEAGQDTFVISTRINDCSLPDTFCFDDLGMPKKKLIEKLSSTLVTVDPDIVICDNPIAILAAQRYKKQASRKIRIVYDVTEWYPSKKNLRGLSFLRKFIKYIALTGLSFYSAWFLDGFIFGEHDKARPFRFLFPWKPYIYLTYYANPDQVKVHPVRDLSKECIFFYAGHLNQEKGFENVLNVASECASRFPETKFILRIIAKDCYEFDRVQSRVNLEIQPFPPLPFLSFCEETGKADLFFDLRKIDGENTRCLPIKLFYYMAAGRPVIYSDLKAIRKGIPEIDKIGILVHPEDTDAIVSRMERYIKDSAYYQSQCAYARQLAEQKYNWANIEHAFVDFIRKLSV
ncbi:hypothetical protein FACS189437_01420 [Bacteroidia bacterium]|nr:hypothetical protein FACS189437_01420 [Bacteroidia bacterium]